MPNRFTRRLANDNSQLIDNIGLVKEEISNMKEYQEKIRAKIQSAQGTVNQSEYSMKNLANKIEDCGYFKTGIYTFHENRG
ncbi:MAG: hypothetical protein JXR70_14645 [Spirochaetales bacterium]|nr:hypothetical protein [Spirochaetales bacterium]